MLKKSKATTPGRRHRVDADRSALHKGKPEKSLLAGGHKKRQGRNSTGHITVRHRGGGVKKKMRMVDFRQDKFNVVGVVKRIEYDPMRSANIALVFYADGEKRYMICPEGLNVGDKVVNSKDAEITVGNTLPLREISVGEAIHNVELEPGRGARIVRSAGTAAYIQAKDEKFATVLLPSKEIRLFKLDCLATVGQVGNQEHQNEKIGKAGRRRLAGIRPGVRGTAQHPGSHPHGGGEGRSGIGLKYPKTPWGKHALGTKTRRKSKSNKMIVRDRRKK